MDQGIAYRCLRAAISALVFCAFAADITLSGAIGQTLPFKVYGFEQGLTNPTVSCMVQGDAGYILACSQHGLFVYDGRIWTNLGRAQGLPDGGVVYYAWISRDNRIVLRYADSVYVSTGPLDAMHGPGNLLFRDAGLQANLVVGDTAVLAGWNGKVLFFNKGHLELIDIASNGNRPTISVLPSSIKLPLSPFSALTPIITSGNIIYAETVDRKICEITEITPVCLDLPVASSGEHWSSFMLQSARKLLARSENRLLELDFRTLQTHAYEIPSKGDMYSKYYGYFFLVKAPGGGIITQTSAGMKRWKDFSWTSLPSFEGLEQPPFFSLLFDHEHQLWFSVPGVGIGRALGYGLWENYASKSGLPSGITWQMARGRIGPLYVATDLGLATIEGNSVLPMEDDDRLARSTFAVAVQDNGQVWRSVGSQGVARYDPSTRAATFYQTPSPNQILKGSDTRVWILTQDGIFVADAADPAPRRLPGTSGPFALAASDGHGGLWSIRGKDVMHVYDDGRVVVVPAAWGTDAFEPVAIAASDPSTVWVGGTGGGVYRLSISHDIVGKIEHVPTNDIQSNTVVALVTDGRGWLWVGTDRGITMYDGTRWRSATVSSGLISNDIDQNAIFVDDDDTLWIGTSSGVSHLLAPEKLFENQPLKAIIDAVAFGDRPYDDGRLIPYTRAALTMDFGMLSFRFDGSVRFRYRMDGVDQQWVETATGSVRYPSVPPGEHLFEMQAFDPLTGEVSNTSTLTIRMRQPWWRSWPVLFGYVVLALLVAYGGARLRFRQLTRQRRRLQRLVEDRTRALEQQTSELQRAQVALRLQAQRDGLTGLLRRTEVQSRIISRLQEHRPETVLTVALLDIDHFKSINDRYGHLAGDDVLKELGQRIEALTGPGRIAGRYGGEEVILIADGAEPDNLAWMHAVYRRVVEEAFLTDAGRLPVTCSMGIGRSLAADTWKTLMERVDNALYDAKRGGRNRIVIDEIGCGKP